MIVSACDINGFIVATAFTMDSIYGEGCRKTNKILEIIKRNIIAALEMRVDIYMNYRIKSMYTLCGWDKRAWALVKHPENNVRYLKQDEFQTLLLCDGSTDFEEEFITHEMRQALRKFKKENVIETCFDKEVLEDKEYYHYYNNRFVKSVFWSITGRCNYRCRHCFLNAPEGKFCELSHEQALCLIDQMAECGVLQVDITGGEPFIRKDFWLLIDRILSYKIAIGQIYTNGYLLNAKILDEFEKRRIKPQICISFDGVGWHDWMRGVIGAEEDVVRVLRLCKERDFPVYVEMCIHKGNQDTISQTVDLLSKMGVIALKVSNVFQTGLWKRNSEGNAMDVREYTEAMLRYIPQFYQAGMPMNVMLAGVITLYKNSQKYSVIPDKYNGTEKCKDKLLCGAARYACYITPEGRLLPCMPMTACKEQEKFPLVQDIGLKKGLSDSFYMDIVDSRVKDLLEANSKCNACEYKYRCGGGCRAIALEQTGDLMGCAGTQCILWNEGYVDRIRETAEAAITKYCSD